MPAIDPPVAVEVLWEGQWWPGWATYRHRMPEGWRYVVDFSTGLMENRRGWVLYPDEVRLRGSDE